MLKQYPYGASAGKPHLSAICFDEPVDRECAGSFRLGAMIYGLAVAASCGGLEVVCLRTNLWIAARMCV